MELSKFNSSLFPLVFLSSTSPKIEERHSTTPTSLIIRDEEEWESPFFVGLLLRNPCCRIPLIRFEFLEAGFSRAAIGATSDEI
jgi:hypothetical protein